MCRQSHSDARGAGGRSAAALVGAMLLGAGCSGGRIVIAPLDPLPRVGASLTVPPGTTRLAIQHHYHASSDSTLASMARRRNTALASYLVLWTASSDSVVLPIYLVDRQEATFETPGGRYATAFADAPRQPLLRLVAAPLRARRRVEIRPIWQRSDASRSASLAGWRAIQWPDSGLGLSFAAPRSAERFDLEIRTDTLVRRQATQRFIVGPDRSIRNIDGYRRCLGVQAGERCAPTDSLPRDLGVLELTFSFNDWVPFDRPLLRARLTCAELSRDSVAMARATLEQSREVSDTQRVHQGAIVDLAEAAAAFLEPGSSGQRADSLLRYRRLDQKFNDGRLSDLRSERARIQECVREGFSGLPPIVDTAVAVLLVDKNADLSRNNDAERLDDVIRPLVLALERVDATEDSPFARGVIAMVGSYEDRISKLLSPLWLALDSFASSERPDAFRGADLARSRLLPAGGRRWACRPCRTETDRLLNRYDSLRVRSIRFAGAKLQLPPGQRDTLHVTLRGGRLSVTSRVPEFSVDSATILEVQDSVIVALRPGSARIHARIDDQDERLTVRVFSVDSIRLLVDGQLLTGDSVELRDSTHFHAAPMASDGTVLPFPVSFRTDVEGGRVITVTLDGHVTRKSTGLATIWVQCGRFSRLVHVRAVAPDDVTP